MSTLSRRDILKISALTLGGTLLAAARPWRGPRQRSDSRPNVIVLVLDALSARHLSFLGYARQTTPNLAQFADRATVYHNHYSGGSFTTPGTASMLTGLYPWAHRALGLGGLVDRSLADQNIFELVGDAYHRFGFTQNRLCNILLEQFGSGLDAKLPVSAFSFHKNALLSEDDLPRDPLMASFIFQEVLAGNGGTSASLSVGYANLVKRVASRSTTDEYPLGFPNNVYEKFKLADIFAGLSQAYLRLSQEPEPFFAYNHLFPPHHPYCPKRDTIKKFLKDGLSIPPKPAHPLAETFISDADLELQRLLYDAYVADLDEELGRFVQGLDASGLLDSSYLIITSDHGELFERSQEGHSAPLLYEGVTRIPLIIRAPGQTQRQDIHALTSNVDLLPSVLSLVGRDLPPHLEGRVLPGLGGSEDPSRFVFTVYGGENSSFMPLTKLVVAGVKDSYKVIYYRGYPDGYDEKFELYDLRNDPEELTDLSAAEPSLTQSLADELLRSLADAERLHRERHGM